MSKGINLASYIKELESIIKSKDSAYEKKLLNE